MNILFLLRSLDIGGLEVVTTVLANKFLEEGHNVFVFAFELRTGKVVDLLGSQIHLTIATGYRYNEQNVELLRSQLKEGKVDIVINQWGLPLIPIKVLNKAKQGLEVKIISVYHNDPLHNGRIQSVEAVMAKTSCLFKKMLLNIKRFVCRCVTGYAMRYIYNKSDCFMLLSSSFISHFQHFTKITDNRKLIVQTNPVTVNSENFVYQCEKKRKEVIFVGRIDYVQKRVYRVVEVWAQLEHCFPDWQLTIVGDGIERSNIERMVADLELQHVRFEGFQSPVPYYERASILLLTSEFEGFPLVLAECMSFGVIPVVYGSYSAVYDIIENDKDGFVIPYKKQGFQSEVMADTLGKVMMNEMKRNDMAIAAIEKSKNYSIDVIYQQWMNIISNIYLHKY